MLQLLETTIFFIAILRGVSLQDFLWAKVDNFDPSNNKTYKQFYDRMWVGHSNVNVLYIEGEGASRVKNLAKGASTDYYAQLISDLYITFNATVYMLQHRYYDTSYPVDNPQTADDFQYLSSQQALADIENFIKFINNGREDQKWITVGGSYPGMLAIWHRQLYSNLTIGTIGSSAPVYAVANLTSFFMVAQNGYKQQFPKCYNWLKEAFSEFKTLLDNKNTTLTTLWPDLAKRYDINDDIQANYFAYHVISDAYTQIQFNMSGICYWYNPLAEESAVQQLARLYTGCEDDVEDPHWKSWMWQVCNEFGFFYSPDDPNCLANGIYDIKKVYEVQCKRLFGSKFTFEYMEKQIQNTLDFYKLDKLYPATNAIITNSVYDPWSGQGLKKAASDTVKFFSIRNATHCDDLQAGENPDIYESRKILKQEVARWIRESGN